MHEHPEPIHPGPSPHHGGGMRTVIWTAGFLLIAAFFLFSEHRAHILGYLPFLLLMACPLMHLFGHGGHRGHGTRGEERTTQPASSTQELRHEH